jgi:cell division protein FtsQ
VGRSKARTEQDPWVKDAAVRRALPGTLYVSVRERVPAALALVGGQVLLVDDTGHPIGPVGEDLSVSLPVLTGLPRDEARLRAGLRRGIDALRDIERASPALARAVSELDLSASDRLALRTIHGDPWLLLDPERVGRNLAAFLDLRAEIDRLVGPVSHIDLRWQDRLILTPATPVTRPPTGEHG